MSECSLDSAVLWVTPSPCKLHDILTSVYNTALKYVARKDVVLFVSYLQVQFMDTNNTTESIFVVFCFPFFINISASQMKFFVIVTIFGCIGNETLSSHVRHFWSTVHSLACTPCRNMEVTEYIDSNMLLNCENTSRKETNPVFSLLLSCELCVAARGGVSFCCSILFLLSSLHPDLTYTGLHRCHGTAPLFFRGNFALTSLWMIL